VIVQFFPDGQDMIVIAANSGLPTHPGWDFNLKAHPEARVEVEGRTLDVRAEELSPRGGRGVLAKRARHSTGLRQIPAAYHSCDSAPPNDPSWW
jgi:deazaflavin-dependent oxidoreductase (nitroreductase family)